jgi:nucleotide-binding universal stress UspA family protein
MSSVRKASEAVSMAYERIVVAVDGSAPSLEAVQRAIGLAGTSHKLSTG